MNRFLGRSAVFAVTAFTLAACGGDSLDELASKSSSQLSLDGNWFFERPGPQGPVYVAESLISDQGTTLVRTYCNRMTETFTRVGSQLFDRDGRLHYLYVQDPSTLKSRPELNYNTVVKKRSSAGRFHSGSVDITMPSGEKVAATTDVCAQANIGRYRDSLGNEIAPQVFGVSLPYRDSFIRISIAFRQLANGQYKVVDFDPFVQGKGNEVTVSDFYSPYLMSPEGGQAVVIASGTVQVSNYTGSSVTVSADLTTFAGGQVKFAANVTLEPQ